MERNISEHFKLSEFKQPTGYGLPELPYPDEWIAPRLSLLCHVLEQIRVELRNMPITILSGYRSVEYNQRHHLAHPGAVIASQHCLGMAADIEVPWFHPKDVHTAIINLYNRKLILIGGLGIYSDFVHVDIRDSKELIQWKG